MQKKIIYTYCLTSVCSPQTNRKPWRVWRGRSSCRCIPKNLKWDKVPEPQRCLARGNPELGRCHTACFVCLFTVQQKCAIPLMPFPRFHLPQAKRADTMKVYSRKLIKSSCLLLHMAASQPPIYKEYKTKNNTRAVHCDNKSSGKCHRRCHMNKLSWMFCLQVLVLIAFTGYWRRAFQVNFSSE